MSSLSCIFFSGHLDSTRNNLFPKAVFVCAMKQSFWVLGGGRRTRGILQSWWSLKSMQENDVSSFFCLHTLVILSFSVSQHHLSHSVWVINTKLFEFIFISQFPQQLKGKWEDRSLPPNHLLTPGFCHYCKSTDIISVRTLRVKY